MLEHRGYDAAGAVKSPLLIEHLGEGHRLAVLAWLYQHTGGLYPSIVAHAVNNATGLILFYAVGIR